MPVLDPDEQFICAIPLVGGGAAGLAFSQRRSKHMLILQLQDGAPWLLESEHLANLALACEVTAIQQRANQPRVSQAYALRRAEVRAMDGTPSWISFRYLLILAGKLRRMDQAAAERRS